MPAVCCQRVVHEDNCFSSGSNLTLWCRQIDYSYIRDNLPATLKQLHIEQSDIPTFHFGEINLPELEKLTLTNNQIMTVFSGTTPYSTYRGLTVLLLNDNVITSIENHSLGHIPLLSVLNLSNNKIRYVNKGAFRDLPSLKQLDLSNNRIMHLSCDLFEAQMTMGWLSLAGNNLGQIFNCMFTEIRKTLKVLDLSQNQLRYIDTKAFGSMPALTQLILSSNELTQIEPESIAGLTNLHTLNLSQNKIHHLGGLLMETLPIRNLILNGNSLQRLARWELRGVAHLTSLHMNDMVNLAYIDPMVFNTLPNLKVLSLKGNVNLTSLDNYILSGSSLLKLEELHLAACGFTSLQRSMFTSLPSLRVASIADNPIKCDCKSFWITTAKQNIHSFPWAHRWAHQNENLPCSSSLETMELLSLPVGLCYPGIPTHDTVATSVSVQTGDTLILKVKLF